MSDVAVIVSRVRVRCVDCGWVGRNRAALGAPWPCPRCGGLHARYVEQPLDQAEAA